MNKGKILKGAAYMVAGLGLFVGSYVIVAARSGAELSELPIIGGMFPERVDVADEESAEPQTIAQEVEEDQRPQHQVIETSENVLSIFALDQPFTSEGLITLEKALEARMGAVEQRLRDLDQREREMNDQSEYLEDWENRLIALNDQLVNLKEESALQGEELDAANRAKEEKLNESRVRAAELYTDGKADEAAKRLLATYPPSEIGRILTFMDTERARNLMEQMHKSSPKEYPDIQKAWIENAPPAE